MGLNNANVIETNRYELEISVDKERFQKAVDKAYKKNVFKMNIPGFRKGKAPRAIVEKLYGDSVFFEDAVNLLYPEVYKEAVTEANIEPVDQADVEIVSVDKDGFVFKAKVTVRPEVEVGEYKGLKAVKKLKSATDEDINNEIERVRNRNARVITVDNRPVQTGDIAVIDFDGSVDGEPFEGGKSEGYSLELGSGQFIPGFEEQVAGHNAGDQFDVNVTFPEDYNVPELAGKQAIFKVTLHEYKFRELPDVDDEFAKDVSEFDTLDAYKADIKKHLEEKFESEAKEDVENKLIEQVIAGMKAEIPEVMYEQATDNLVSSFDQRMRSQGLTLETYLQYAGMDMEAFRKSYHEQAEQQVKTRLSLDKIAEIEKFEVSPEETEEEYKKYAERYTMPIESVKIAINAKDLEKDILMGKAIELIRSTAIVSEEKSQEGAESEAPVPEAAEDKPAKAKPAAKRAPRKTAKKAESEETDIEKTEPTENESPEQ